MFRRNAGMRSLAALHLAPRIGSKNRLERFLTWWMFFIHHGPQGETQGCVS